MNQGDTKKVLAVIEEEIAAATDVVKAERENFAHLADVTRRRLGTQLDLKIAKLATLRETLTGEVGTSTASVAAFTDRVTAQIAQVVE